MARVNGNGDKCKPDSKPRLVRVSPQDLIPSPENDTLYSTKADDIVAFSAHIRERGVIEPIVATRDYYVISGHRRRAAAILAGLSEVPCRLLPESRGDFTADEYVKLLREFNRQRAKTIDEIIRESVVDANPEVAFASLNESRIRKSRATAGEFEIRGETHRCEISDAKRPMLEAVQLVITQFEEFWPLTVRIIHYRLLNNPPLRHSKKPESTYGNTRADYGDLCDLITRARFAGEIEWACITDETRPMKLWPTDRNVSGYITSELKGLFGNYWRDLMQSQQDAFEILVEKNTALSVIEKLGRKYTIPITSARGQCCKPRLLQMANRFENSGKDRLVVFLLSDFDPSGDIISNSAARSLRDDFELGDRIVPVRVAIRPDQVKKFNLPRSLEIKETNAAVKTAKEKFIDRHGLDFACELESMNPKDLQSELDSQIRAYIDVDAFNKETKVEIQEAAELANYKSAILACMREFQKGAA